MSRGVITLHQKIFVEPKAEKHKKGRSQVLNARRNELLIERYYFYCELGRWRYDVIIKILSLEFFLSPVTIPELIDNHFKTLKEAKNRYKDMDKEDVKKQLQKKWPHMEWCRVLSQEALDRLDVIN